MTFAVIIAVVSVGACGSNDNDTSPGSAARQSTTSGPSSAGTTSLSPGTSAAAGAQTIAIQGFKFNPSPLPTEPGKVTIINMDDGAPHSVTADDKSFDTGVFKKENGPRTITLSKTGTFNYHCQVHDFMKGSIQVR